MKKLFFKKRGAPLGQHLLTSSYIARDVANAAEVSKKDIVLEVGPGKGMLTTELLKLGAKVIAIEKDPAMTSLLRERFTKEIHHKELILIEKDVRDYLKSFSIEKPYKVVANIPYYITGELIRSFLTANTQPKTISLLVQKEVAERIAKNKKESILSLSVKVFGEPRYMKTVKAGSFNPPPKVDSAILLISNISRENFNDVSEDLFFNTVRQGFSQKRKTLLGNLKKKYKKEDLESFWSTQNFDKNVRAEDVPLGRWLSLTSELQKIKGQKPVL